MWTSLVYACLCTALHSCAFIVEEKLPVLGIKQRLSLGQQNSYYNKVVSTAHAIIMFLSSCYYWCWINRDMVIGAKCSMYEMRCLRLMVGYLIYDICYEASNTNQMDILAHHFLGLGSHLSTLISGHGACGFYSMMVFLAEGSSPFLNLSWLMHHLRLNHTVMFKASVLTLICTFFVLRVMLCTFTITHMWLRREQWGVDAGTALFWFNFLVVALFVLLNYFWFYKLVAVAAK